MEMITRICLMKKITLFSFFALAILSFGACQKDVVSSDVDEQVQNLVTVTFTAEKVVDTRTTAVEGESSVSYEWTDDDVANMHLYLVTEEEVEENGTTVTKSVETEVTDKTVAIQSPTKLTISANVSSAESYTFRAKLFTETTSGGSPKSLSSQYPDGTSSYDPTADILLSEDLTTTETSGLLLTFSRKVVVNKMTLKGLTPEEHVKEVTITSDKNIVGYLNGTTMNGQTKSITLHYSNVEVPDNGQFPVYFVTMPQAGQTLTVVVTVNEGYTYYKTFGGGNLEFKLGSFTRFGVNNLTKAEIVDLSGTYVLVNAGGSFMAKAYVDEDTKLTSTSTTLEEGTVYYDPDDVDINSAKVTLAKVSINGTDYYTIAQNSKYLYAAGAKEGDNHLKAATSIPEENNGGYYWSISNTSGSWSVVANRTQYSNILQMNTSGHNFTCYAAATQTAVSLVPNYAPTPVITAINIALVDGNAITTATDLGASFNSNTASVTAAAYDDETLNTNSSWLTVSVTGNTVKYTALANNTGNERVAYVKINATNSNNRTVSKTIEVSQPALGSTSMTDHITYSLIGVSGTSYTAWSGKTSVSDAVYAGKTAGGNNSIQINATSGNGIYSSSSGGYLKKISIIWNSNNTNTSRKVTVYANNTAYTSPSSSGTKVVEFAVGGSTTSYDFTDNFQYISIVANGAVYLDEIAITWDSNPFMETVAKPSISVSSNVITITCATEGASIYYTTDNTTPSVSSHLYTSPISLNEGDSYTVKAIAVKENYYDSEVATKAVSYVAPSNNYYVLLPTDVPEVSAYSSTEKSVTAEDKSVWKLKGYGASETRIQLGKGGDNFILTPECGSAISSITVDCTSSYYLTVQNTDGEELIAAQPEDGVITFDLSSYSYTQVKLVARRSSGTSNAAVYITKIQLNY